MKYLLFAFCVFFVACTSKVELLPQARNIEIYHEKPIGCKVLDRAIGQKVDTWSSMSLLELRESALNDLKNKASNLGGDTLYILNMEKGWNSFWGCAEYLIEGEIYKCK